MYKNIDLYDWIDGCLLLKVSLTILIIYDVYECFVNIGFYRVTSLYYFDQIYFNVPLSFLRIYKTTRHSLYSNAGVAGTGDDLWVAQILYSLQILPKITESLSRAPLAGKNRTKRSL